MSTADCDSLFHRDLNQEYPVMVRGEGIYLYDDAGRRYIDGHSGAGNVILGHGNKRIAAAMAEQAGTLAYCFSAFHTNQPARELSRRIAALAPGDLDCVYFVSGGSEGIETALKIARQYHLQQGNRQKFRVIARWRGYHGATLGALSATGMPALREPFSPWLLPFHHIAPCYPYRCSFAGCDSRCNYSCANELEKAILQLGPDNVAAFVCEPVVQGGIAAGVPPEEYYGIVRETCDKYGVLFIADEIITGFGRTGKPFAIEHWDVVPDMIVFGKAASAGYCPLSGVIMRGGIRDSFRGSGDSFAHVFTYVDNPVAMRVGLTVQDILDEEQVDRRGRGDRRLPAREGAAATRAPSHRRRDPRQGDAAGDRAGKGPRHPRAVPGLGERPQADGRADVRARPVSLGHGRLRRLEERRRRALLPAADHHPGPRSTRGWGSSTRRSAGSRESSVLQAETGRCGAN